MNYLQSRLRSLRDFIADFRLVLGDGWRRMPGVFALMLLAMALDLLGVSLVAPFLSALLSPGAPMPTWLPFGQALSDGSGLRWLAVALLLAYCVKGLAAYWTQLWITRVTENERARLMDRLLGAFQAMPYEQHLQRNSADLVNTVIWHTQAYTNGVLGASLRLFADVLVFVAMGILLALTDVRAVLLLLAVLAVVFVVAGRTVRPRLARAYEKGANLHADLYLSVSQALAGLREVRILGREGYFRERLRAAATKLAEASAEANALHMIPRQSVEVAVVGFLVALVWITHAGNQEASALVPVLATFAAASMRLMPASTAILNNWNNLRSYRFSLRELRRVVGYGEPQADAATPTVPSAGPSSEKFRDLVVEGATFAYAGANAAVLDRVSFRLAAGETAGLVGRSGAGKSTLADVVLGLLVPQSGRILVNGWNIADDVTRWHRMVAYIPQTVYLTDDSLRRNIALGIPDGEIDERRLREAVADAQLAEVVAGLPQGLDTHVGERGARLSGGQRQRVAIARALYYGREVLVLDEATSALDPETEAAVVATIKALRERRTLIVIAHKPELLSNASVIVRLEHESAAES